MKNKIKILKSCQKRKYKNINQLQKKAPETAPTNIINVAEKRTIIIIRCSELFRQ